MWQFGVFVIKDKFQNVGIGIQLNYGKVKDFMGFIFLNKFFEEMELDINIVGFFLYKFILNFQYLIRILKKKKFNYVILLFYIVDFEFIMKKIII